ncbi:MAG: coenzyme F430 synthase [Euryarchaeota archaeon]|nr:coenzyme F430 synthase [Euryarchaeota archaeon]MBU4607472.1 coenzyme F430 synthase [Euryarchaeota archaeon]MBV1730561.1 coenzyme F430 synthase [Methanobacterium sp.]MBV1756091.1 coenzyme F430 synthase [Methanobacterium sp.]MBV1768344.1 coenzyme F430 synthase [Methanobacterium sp.]
MNALVIDLTHGGFKIALELLETKYENIWAWDIYHSLNDTQKNLLESKGIKLTSEIPLVDNLDIIAPVHCPLDIEIDLTHHAAVKYILEDWKKIEIPVIEVTGVKGKSSVVGILKEIFIFRKPLVLSSLGAEYLENKSVINLKKNISITPASIIDTIQLAKNYEYDICIFETSLGGTGLADVGILTNVVEDYVIAQGKSKASTAKSQIFKSQIICCEKETLDQYYSHLNENIVSRINSYSLKNPDAKVNVLNVKYGLDKTFIEVDVKNLKTISGKTRNTRLHIETFAPAPHHVSNVLAALSAALSLDVDINDLLVGLSRFKGVKGRTSLKKEGDITIIEEVNPGINVKALEKTIKMAQSMENSIVILGGEYGITCEEIDELEAAKLLNSFKMHIPLILTDQLGRGILKKMESPSIFIENPQEALNYAIKNGARKIVFIYRSNYSNLKKR